MSSSVKPYLFMFFVIPDLSEQLLAKSVRLAPEGMQGYFYVNDENVALLVNFIVIY
jgi:hypothetical protein